METIKGIVYFRMIEYLEMQLSEKAFLSLKKEKNSRSEALRKAWVLSNDYPMDYWEEIIAILESQKIDPYQFMEKSAENFANIIIKQFFSALEESTPISTRLEYLVRLYPFYLSFGRLEFSTQTDVYFLKITAKTEISETVQTFLSAFYKQVFSVWNYNATIESILTKLSDEEYSLTMEFRKND